MIETWLRVMSALTVGLGLLQGPALVPANGQGIELRVLNQQGEPAVRAHVEVYATGTTVRYWNGDTNADGRATIDLADGTWVIVASSTADHFVLVMEDVVAPGTVSLDTSGAVLVEILVNLPAGGLPVGPRVSFERFGGTNSVWRGDSNGPLWASLSPGTYCGLAQRMGSPAYHLEQRGIEVTVPMTVTFDATEAPTGEVVMHLADPANSRASVTAGSSCRTWTSPLWIADGKSLVVSPGSYTLSAILKAGWSGEDDGWDFHYALPGAPQDIAAGSVTDVWLGGAHTASVSPSGSSTFAPGDRVIISPQIVDDHGNLLTQISGGPPGWSSLARMVVRDPEGEVQYQGDCDWSLSDQCALDLANDAPDGCYRVDWSLDAGPVLGMLEAGTSFAVGIGPTCTAIPTATASPTPTATATPSPTATPTATPSLSRYLPMLMKGS